jgi:hypothetical protein
MTVSTAILRGSKAKGAGIAVDLNDKIRRLSPTQRNKVVGPRQREQSAHNGHCESTCYHPLLLFNREGNLPTGTDWSIGRFEIGEAKPKS